MPEPVEAMQTASLDRLAKTEAARPSLLAANQTVGLWRMLPT